MVSAYSMLTVAQHDDICRNGSPCFAVDIEGKGRVYPIAVATKTSSQIEIGNCDYDYSLPLIIARRIGDAIVWFANDRFPVIPPFDRFPIVAFEASAYLLALHPFNYTAPSGGTSEDLFSSASRAITLLPDYTLVEYCIPEFNGDDCGKQTWRKYIDAMKREMIFPSECEARRLSGCHETLEIGVQGNRELILEAVGGDATWFRLVSPNVFPIWIMGERDARHKNSDSR